jgi:gluconokinase
MSRGEPLDDSDRFPWLERIGEWLAAHESGGVIACSALKRKYRDQLRHHCSSVEFLHLEGGRDVIEKRQASRPGHFMPASLLTSQFQTLEPLAPDEDGTVVDVVGSVDEIVEGYLAVTRREEAE